MAPLALPSSILPIEVSGWDDEKRFFVERSDLEWSEGGRRTVLLRNRLRTGSVVFVRLATLSDLGKSRPIAHRTESVEPSESQDGFRVRLVESRPKRATFDATIDPLEHLIGVGERIQP